MLNSDGSLNSLFVSPFTFGGMMCDIASGLYLAKRRIYDPRIERWLTRDPAQEAGRTESVSH